MFEYFLTAIFILAVYFTIRREKRTFFYKWFVFLAPAVFIIYSLSFREAKLSLFSVIWISLFMAFMLAALMAYAPNWIRLFLRKKNKNNPYDSNEKN